MKVVIGQGSCGVATGAKKTAAEFEKLIAEKNIDLYLQKYESLRIHWMNYIF